LVELEEVELEDDDDDELSVYSVIVDTYLTHYPSSFYE
jgi:hypothetical protein